MSEPTDAGRTVTADFRAWTEPDKPTKKRVNKRQQGAVQPVKHILVVDTETTTDPTQALTFGGWIHGRVEANGTVTRLAEGIFHADDLEDTDPDGYRTLRRAALGGVAQVSRTREADRHIRFETRTEFIESTFYKLAYVTRAHVVMFNKSFDLSRLALKASEARGYDYGGFSFQLWNNDLYRPRVAVKHIDSKKALASFKRPGRKVAGFVDGETNHGFFLDLRTWAFALTGSAHSLRSACEAFGVEHGKHVTETHGVITRDYIDYARRDVLATTELFVKLYAEHRKHPIELEPSQAFSTASVAKQYLYALGVVPRLTLDNLGVDVLGAAMESFYGGRAECRIRHVAVPVELHDFTSMYPTVNALMGLWGLLTSERISAVESTESVAELLESVSLRSMFERGSWPELVGIAEVLPDRDVLPVRAVYSEREGSTIGVNPVVSDEPHFWTIADLVASKILSGKTPKVLRAFRFIGSGRLDTLKPTSIRGQGDVDPNGDFFVRVVEMRAEAKTRAKRNPHHVVEGRCSCEDCSLSDFLKVLANSGSYGIFSEMNAQDKPIEKPDTVRVISGRGTEFMATVPGREIPGHMCFPPIATCITGGARLMLAMLERCVTDLGGAWAFCDTDSLAIVANETGTPVACPSATGDTILALSFAQCAEIRERFSQLSPYDRLAVPSLLKDEERAWCLSVSAKRYALYKLADDGSPVVVPGKYSEHGLGHLSNPADPRGDRDNRRWIRDYWEWRIRQYLGMKPEPLPWFERTAVGTFSASSPMLLRAFARFNKGKSYRDSVKPFSFMVVAFPDTMRSYGIGRLIAPYEPDASQWHDLEWVNLANPDDGTYRVTMDMDAENERTLLGKTYKDILQTHWRHPEPKFLGPHGERCLGETMGLLCRRTTVIGRTRLIGKESNKFEEIDAGVMTGTSVTTYGEASSVDVRPIARAVLSGRTAQSLARLSGTGAFNMVTGLAPVSPRTVKRFRSGDALSPRAERTVLTLAAYLTADTVATDNGERLALLSGPPELVLLAYGRLVGSQPPRRECVCGCGGPVAGRARYAGPSCRVRSSRAHGR